MSAPIKRKNGRIKTIFNGSVQTFKQFLTDLIPILVFGLANHLFTLQNISPISVFLYISTYYIVKSNFWSSKYIQKTGFVLFFNRLQFAGKKNFVLLQPS